VKNRRNLTPPAGVPVGDVHATRRGGARLEVSARVSLRPLSASAPPKVLEGWALNVSRGGVRVILEEKIEPGTHFEVTLIGGTGPGDPLSPQVGRVVWVQEEPDGVVAGIEFRSEGDKP
jgi:PilZ domain